MARVGLHPGTATTATPQPRLGPHSFRPPGAHARLGLSHVLRGLVPRVPEAAFQHNTKHRGAAPGPLPQERFEALESLLEEPGGGQDRLDRRPGLAGGGQHSPTLAGHPLFTRTLLEEPVAASKYPLVR